MENVKKSHAEAGDKEIVFSQAIKAGKRIYYVDVKKNRKDEMFLAITESKKVVTGENEVPQISFEKHKIFLYQEDFDKFMNGLQQAIHYIRTEQPNVVNKEENATPQDCTTSGNEDNSTSEIKIDIDF